MTLSVAVTTTSNVGGTDSRERRPMNVESRVYELVVLPPEQVQGFEDPGEVPQPEVWLTNDLVTESLISTYDRMSAGSCSCSSASRWPTSCAIVAHSSSSRRGTTRWVSEKLSAMPRSVTLQKLSADAIPNSSFGPKPISWPVPPTTASMYVPPVGSASTTSTLKRRKCVRTHDAIAVQLNVAVLSGGIVNVGALILSMNRLFTRFTAASV